MPTNEIQVFARDGSEAQGDVMTPEDYASDPQTAIGHQAGIARRELENTALRQLSRFCNGVAAYIAQHYEPGVVDDGDAAKIMAGMAAAVQAALGEHEQDTDNPHGTTAELVGAVRTDFGNVDRVTLLSDRMTLDLGFGSILFGRVDSMPDNSIMGGQRVLMRNRDSVDLAFGHVVDFGVVNVDGVQRSDADHASRHPVSGIVAEPILVGERGWVVIGPCFARSTALWSSLAIKTELFLDVNPGMITDSASVPGQYVQRLGVGLGSGVIFFSSAGTTLKARE